jgi:hypothetical protein
MGIKIFSDDSIHLDGANTGFKIAQRATKTVIYSPECTVNGKAYMEHAMPFNRYSTACDIPSSGNPGLSQLETDVKGLMREMQLQGNDSGNPVIRGTHADEYRIYLACADDGKGGDITRNGAPLKTYDEWLMS